MALFNNDSAGQNKQAHPMLPGQLNLIGEGTLFEGTLQARSDLRISGRVEGKVQVEGKVLVATDGSVEGELVATNADVAGQVKGDLHIAERLVLKGSAHVTGTIRAGRLVVEEGAVFDGECLMGEGRRLTLDPAKTNGSVTRPEKKAAVS